ncbi:MAG: ABC transporter permease [Phycisphaerae bacterium]
MLLVRLKRTVKLGAKSLWMHRLRSTLTALGIVFGVASVIAMLAIGEGASRAARDQIARLGARNIIVRTVKPAEQRTARSNTDTVQAYGLTYDDAERIRQTLPQVREVVPKRLLTFQTWYRNRAVTVQLVGTVPWHPQVHPVHVVRGRFLLPMDMDYQQNVAVVDGQVAELLFAVDDPLGADIKVGNKYYHVVGLVTASGQTPAGRAGGGTGNGEEASEGGTIAGNVYIPLTAFRKSFGEMSVQYAGGTRQAEKVELQEITVTVDSTDSVLPTRDILEVLLRRFHEKKDFQVVVPLELLREAARTKRIFNIVLGSIAAISLLVGGMGIMNIMLATVSERTREIGVRRALGATKRDVVFQFLSETLLLTLAGGLLGIVVGLVLPAIVSRLGQMPTVITGGSILLAFGISAAVGVTFGMYPAWRAANMDPIESLRRE